jgi:hypothetical protein
MTSLLLLLSCSQSPNRHVVPLPADPSYVDARLRIDRERTRLSRQHAAGANVIEEARESLTWAITDVLMPEWEGTPWAFYGEAHAPERGHIACGHYVARLFGHAGLDVHERELGQQASEHILLTVGDPDEVKRFSRKPALEVVNATAAMGEGLYVLGLDHHAALLWVHGGGVQMCHSAPGQGVTCEPALVAESFESNYRVVGPAFSDETVEAWLEETRIPTVTR